MTRLFALCLTLTSSALAAQQPTLVGSWRISYTAGMRVEDGASTPIMATGTLTIQLQGDSLIGELVTDSMPGLQQRPPARLAGAARGAAATFVSRSKAVVNINGERTEATAVSTWTLRASGDSLSGTVQRALEGVPAGPQGPTPVTGARRKA